jgi:drug/metabolite transporter (DMT)-like permease
VVETALPAVARAKHRRPRVGYAMVLGAAALFAINGTVSKVLLTATGVSTQRLTELRTTGALIGVGLAILVIAPRSFRLTRAEIPLLAFYGICGFALVQWLYFVAIQHLPIGIGLLIEYTAPVLVAVWVRFVWHEPVRKRVWAALALALTGLALVAEIWSGLALDGIGVLAGFGAAAALAVYYLAGEHGVGKRDPLSLVFWGLFFAAAFWAIVQPWWSFPFSLLEGDVSLLGSYAGTASPVWLLALWMIVLGTIVPFTLSIGALQHLPATRVAVVAMVEPVLASIVAWVWLEETLSPVQLVGGAVTLVGIVLAQTSR